MLTGAVVTEEHENLAFKEIQMQVVNGDVARLGVAPTEGEDNVNRS
jgi:hypothetical protein